MKKDSVATGILKALSKIEDEDLVQEELARKAAARKTRVDADLDAEDASQQEKKGVRRALSLQCCCYVFAVNFTTAWLKKGVGS